MDIQPEYVIDTQGLSKNYNGVEALKALDLRVEVSSSTGILSKIA